MANFDTEIPEEYNSQIKMLEKTDTNANTNFNEIFQNIISNQSYLLNKIEALTTENSTLKSQLNALKVRTPYDQLVAMGAVKDIEVGGSADTYYPVSIGFSTNRNWYPIEFSIGKHLGSKTANYEGNHTNGTSSCHYHWMLRTSGWDGNGNWCKTIYTTYEYAPLLSHIEMQGNAYYGIVVWLRGGGTVYTLCCNVTYSANIYYSAINLGSEQHPYNVSPRKDIGNAGAINRYSGKGVHGFVSQTLT